MDSEAGMSKGATVVVIFFLVGLGVLLLSRKSTEPGMMETENVAVEEMSPTSIPTPTGQDQLPTEVQ